MNPFAKHFFQKNIIFVEATKVFSLKTSLQVIYQKFFYQNRRFVSFSLWGLTQTALQETIADGKITQTGL